MVFNQFHDLLDVGGGGAGVRLLEDYHVAHAVVVLVPSHGDWKWFRLVGFPFHLIDVPAGIEQRKVADAHVGAVAFHLLGVPEWEGVVVAHRKDDGVRGAGVEVGFRCRQGGIAVGTVVVIPVLAGHQAGNQPGANEGDEDRCQNLHAFVLDFFKQ